VIEEPSYWQDRFPTGRRIGAAIGAPAAVFAWFVFAWFVFAWQGTPADSLDPPCPGGVPLWWPSWIPS
jgi:hypothetical protein